MNSAPSCSAHLYELGILVWRDVRASPHVQHLRQGEGAQGTCRGCCCRQCEDRRLGFKWMHAANTRACTVAETPLGGDPSVGWQHEVTCRRTNRADWRLPHHQQAPAARAPRAPGGTPSRCQTFGLPSRWPAWEIGHECRRARIAAWQRAKAVEANTFAQLHVATQIVQRTLLRQGGNSARACTHLFRVVGVVHRDQVVLCAAAAARAAVHRQQRSVRLHLLWCLHMGKEGGMKICSLGLKIRR